MSRFEVVDECYCDTTTVSWVQYSTFSTFWKRLSSVSAASFVGVGSGLWIDTDALGWDSYASRQSRHQTRTNFGDIAFGTSSLEISAVGPHTAGIRGVI